MIMIMKMIILCLQKTCSFLSKKKFLFRKLEIIDEQMKDECSFFQYQKWIFPLLSYILCIFIYVLRGTPQIPSIIGIKSCSFMFWFLLGIDIVISVIITTIQGVIIHKEYQNKVKMGFPFYKNDIHWDYKTLIIIPLIAFGMGLIATGIGIGGGLILGPFLLSFIENPLVSTSSSNTLVVFTSSSSVIQFAIMGHIDWRYASFTMLFGITGSLIGSLLISSIVKKTGRLSYLIIILGFACLISAIVLPVNSILNFVHRVKKGFSLWEGGKFC